MVIYLLKDNNPEGGYYCAEGERPDMSIQRSTVVEVRQVEVPDEVWNLVLEGGLPVDDLGTNPNNDSTWIEWWPSGTTIWTR